MKFRIKVADASNEWWEDCDKNTADPYQWARKTLASFNASLHKGESRRKLLEVEVLDATSRAEHTWSKQNTFTVVEKGGESYDVMRCERCGITGKRYGLAAGVILDTRFAKANVYRRCDTAQAHLERIQQRKAAEAEGGE